VSERDLVVAREALDAYNAIDFERLPTLLHPDCELVMLRSLIDGAPYYGHAGMHQFIRDMADEWTEWHLEPDEFRDLGDGRVLVLARFEGHARVSGIEISAPAAWLLEMRDGLVYKVRAFSDRAASLEYLGLEV
jgi:ketosteroid isomerase-like protein